MQNPLLKQSDYTTFAPIICFCSILLDPPQNIEQQAQSVSNDNQFYAESRSDSKQFRLEIDFKWTIKMCVQNAQYIMFSDVYDDEKESFKIFFHSNCVP